MIHATNNVRIGVRVGVGIRVRFRVRVTLRVRFRVRVRFRIKVLIRCRFKVTHPYDKLVLFFPFQIGFQSERLRILDKRLKAVCKFDRFLIS